MPVRLLVNATILNQPHLTGLGVYVAGLLPPLLKLCIDHEGWSEIMLAGRPDSLVEILGDVTSHREVRLLPVDTCHPIARLVALDRLVVKERQGSSELVFYSPTHHGVVRGGIKQMITIHDLFARIFPRNYRQQYWYFRWVLPRILAQCNHVIVDSNSTGHDLRRFYHGIPTTTVIPAALRTDFANTPPCEVEGLANEKYFLFVGPNYWYKNCLSLIDAFAGYRSSGAAKLVFVGGREAYLGELRQHLRESHPGLVEDVYFLGYVAPGQLVWLYRHAVALMITTLYEGFGLPALEAMACDCPVIASRAGSLPEVCGEAAWFVDPENVSDILLAMSEIEADGTRRQTLITAGRENLRRYSWEASAREVFNVLTSISAPSN